MDPPPSALPGPGTEGPGSAGTIRAVWSLPRGPERVAAVGSGTARVSPARGDLVRARVGKAFTWREGERCAWRLRQILQQVKMNVFLP